MFLFLFFHLYFAVSLLTLVSFESPHDNDEDNQKIRWSWNCSVTAGSSWIIINVFIVEDAISYLIFVSLHL